MPMTKVLGWVRRQRGHAAVAILVAGALLATTACSSDTPLAMPPSEPVVTLDPTLQAEAVAARDRGAAYLADRFAIIDPLHLSGLGYLHRRWAISALDDATDVGRASLERLRAAGGRADGTRRSTDGGDGDLRVAIDPTEILALQRYIDPGSTDVPDRATMNEVSALLADGLYCDVAPLNDDDLDRWDELTDRGGYEATHVVMAWITASEVGCDDPSITAAGQRAADRVTADLNARVAAGPSPTDVDDLLLEQVAFLERVGRGEVLSPALVEAIVAAQLPDGGWPWEAGGTTSDWHATALAVWALSAATTPSNDTGWVEM